MMPGVHCRVYLLHQFNQLIARGLFMRFHSVPLSPGFARN
jgi:hypothetical protein